MKILLFSRYGRLGASSRIRSYQYFSFLAAHNVEVTAFPLFDDEYLRQVYAGKGQPKFKIMYAYIHRLIKLLRASGTSFYDFIWVEKELFPFMPAWGEALLSHFKIPYVVDYDDAVFHRYDVHSRVLVRNLLGDKIDKVMRGAALVIAGNDYLADRARKSGARRVAILPTVVDLECYRRQPVPHRDKFTIGWIGSPSTARGHLKYIEKVLSEFCHDGASRLVLVGSGEVNIEGVPLEIRPWSEETEVDDIQSFDVGIMPLPDSPWERGKCGYKLIQCMACGLPVIASPVGVNQRIVEHGVNGFLAASPTEWLGALSTLRNSPELRQSMGDAARRKVQSEYNLEVHAPRLLEMLRSVAEEYR